MPSTRQLPLLNIQHARNKQVQTTLKSSSEQDQLTGSSSFGSLSPNLQPPTPPTFSASVESLCPSRIGRYILIQQTDRDMCTCVDVNTQEKYICKAVKGDHYHGISSAHFRLDSMSYINQIKEILVGETRTYMIYDWSYGDLHSYVRERRRLKESEAVHLFYQVAAAVAACHDCGVILRDLKLRRFVFKDQRKTELMLETLDDAYILEEDDDSLADKHGCPAYVSPEILSTSGSYSGKAADVWSLGVMLYTMLVGRYPFHDTEPAVLFSKIRRGHFVIPDTVSSKAKCLIRSLLRRDPNERLSAEEALHHPWFKADSCKLDSDVSLSSTNSRARCFASDRKTSDKLTVNDQTVPEIDSINIYRKKTADVGGKNCLETSSNNDSPFIFL